MGGTLYARLSPNHLNIFAHTLVSINCTIIVDVQHTFYFDLDLFSDPGQGHKNFFSCMLYLIVMNVNCHFLLVNYMPIIISLKF